MFAKFVTDAAKFNTVQKLAIAAAFMHNAGGQTKFVSVFENELQGDIFTVYFSAGTDQSLYQPASPLD